MHSSDTLVVQNESSGQQHLSQRQPPPARSGTSPTGLQQYLRVLRKERWIVAGCIAGCVFLALILSLRATPMFEARSRLAILKDTPPDLGLKDVPADSGEDWDYTVTLDTQSAILKSDALALQVSRELRLNQNPWFLKRSGKDMLADDPKAEAVILANFMKGLKVTPVLHTRLLEIRYVSPDPALSAEIVNRLVRDYLEQNFRTRFEATAQKSDWLSRQLEDMRAKVESSQEKLVEYQKSNNILGLDEKQNIVTSKLDELNKELTLAQAQRIEKEATYRNALSANPELSVSRREQGIPEALRTRQAELKQKYARLTTRFGPAYPRVIELRNELNQVESEIEAERLQISKRLALEYETARRREEMLSAALEAQKQEASRLNRSAIEYSILKRDAEANRQLYEGLLQKLKEASVTAGLRSSSVRIVDPARTPGKPVSPNIPGNIAIGLVMGVFLGVVAAIIADSLDNAIRTTEDVQEIAGLPTLGVVPLAPGDSARDRQGQRSLPASCAPMQEELVSQDQPSSPMTESYRSVRTSMLLSSSGSRRRVWLVTSALPQEGKTTTAVNIAAVLAQNGARVLLVDADLRRPVIHKRFGLQPGGGLSTLLSGRCDEGDVIAECDAVPNLFLLPAGPVPARPAELLGADELGDYVARWQRDFDHVVLDSCPVLPVTDAALLSAVADSVMLVLRAGHTTRHEFRQACDVLQQVNANIFGVVINGADLSSPEYRSYGKRYRYYASPK